jgi:hypothetical protein
MKYLDRSSLGMLLIAMGMAALGVAFVLLHLVSPSDGARLDPGQAVWSTRGVLLTPLQEGGSALHRNDLLIAIDGTHIEALARNLFEPTLSDPGSRWQFGREVTYTVIRDGRQLDVPVRLGHFPLISILKEAWGTILLALVFQFVAVFVFLHRPTETVARTMLLGASGLLGATTWSFGLQVSDLVYSAGFWLFQATTYGCYQLFWAAGLHFTLSFAYPHSSVLRRPWLIWLIYVVSLVFYPLNLALTWFGSANTLDWLGRWSAGEGVLSLVYLALAVIAIIQGYRTSHDALLRQKIRWVVFIASLCGIAGILLWMIPTDILGHSIISVNMLGLLVLPFPVSLAIAILRHHLFDIDIIINRTLVYGTLTALLALVYFGLVVVLQALTRALTGQASQSPLIVVVSTLAIAALFQPLRRHIQRIIDRRFYRSKYDAALTLAAFSATLRSEVDLDQLKQHLLTVVQETMQPTHLSLWIRPVEHDGKNNSSASPGASDQEE